MTAPGANAHSRRHAVQKPTPRCSWRTRHTADGLTREPSLGRPGPRHTEPRQSSARPASWFPRHPSTLRETNTAWSALNAERIENQDSAAAILSFVYKLPLPIKKHSKYLSEPHLASATHQDRRLGLCATCTRGLITPAMVTAARHRHGDTGPGECDRAGPAREARTLGRCSQRRPHGCARTRDPRSYQERVMVGHSLAGHGWGGRRRRGSEGPAGCRGDRLNRWLLLCPYQNGAGTRESRRTRGCVGHDRPRSGPRGGPHRQTSGAREGGAPTRTPAVSCRRQHLAVSEIQNHF